MPDNFYKVNRGIPQKLSRKKPSTGLIKSIGKGQLLFLVIGIYLLGGSVLGILLFNSSGEETAQADSSAFVVSTMKISEENKEYKLQDPIKFEITVQNTSNSELLSDLAIDLYSSDNSIKWSNSITNSTNGKILAGGGNHYNLSTLGLGEKSVYVVSGLLENNQKDITAYAKVSFVNKNGVTQTDTNKVYLKKVFYEVKMVGSSSL